VIVACCCDNLRGALEAALTRFLLDIRKNRFMMMKD
jgi:hypothetical protein